jgi:hypothetical protein
MINNLIIFKKNASLTGTTIFTNVDELIDPTKFADFKSFFEYID